MLRYFWEQDKNCEDDETTYKELGLALLQLLKAFDVPTDFIKNAELLLFVIDCLLFKWNQYDDDDSNTQMWIDEVVTNLLSAYTFLKGEFN